MTMHKKHHYRELLSIGISYHHRTAGNHHPGIRRYADDRPSQYPRTGGSRTGKQYLRSRFVSYMGFTYGLTPIIGTALRRGTYRLHRTESAQLLLCQHADGHASSPSPSIVLYLEPGAYRTAGGTARAHPPLLSGEPRLGALHGHLLTMKQFLDGIGQTKVAMWAMIGGNVVNILGNWVLIYGVAGFPELGLLGAGISTLVSRILMALAMVGMVMACRKFADYSHDIIHSCKQG